MSDIILLFDKLIAVFWVLTYLLIIVSTIKNKYPSISPKAQLVSIALELSVVLFYLIKWDFKIKYVIVGYVLFVVLELINVGSLN